MPITNQEAWNNHVAINQSEYGKACVDVARRAMELLDEEPGEFDPHDIISRADDEALGEDSGITGFMAGAVASMISQCHSRGKEFQEVWNAQYDGMGGEEAQENDGVINPALMTVSIKE